MINWQNDFLVTLQFTKCLFSDIANWQNAFFGENGKLTTCLLGDNANWQNACLITANWWNAILVALPFDKMLFLVKWSTDKMPFWWHFQLTKCFLVTLPIDKMPLCWKCQATQEMIIFLQLIPLKNKVLVRFWFWLGWLSIINNLIIICNYITN